ncbi:hypothetical protein PE067_09500 [Paracoccus sp. DMF-8]|uniref:hypothetical protein n=1 Tax=Paracoccus sp. DMF-8 TaxID=3019445 RepID=UPI0023E7ABB1|nr:hypothetical protein [Paracoccus sp. DMF-8]MDF3606354.1 hypothetical protein [Paracoccus sp. DMF-8]
MLSSPLEKPRMRLVDAVCDRARTKPLIDEIGGAGRSFAVGAFARLDRQQQIAGPCVKQVDIA